MCWETRYAVFDIDGNIVELKGFELKRRGELQIIKIFQEDVFPQFFTGNSRKETYNNVGTVANRWLKFLSTKGKSMETWHDILNLVKESKTLSKPAIENDGLKSFGITTAFRLKDLLDDESYIRDPGVKTEFIISKEPQGADKTDRAIPVTVFEEIQKRETWISKWTTSEKAGFVQQRFFKHKSQTFNLPDLLDWAYYRDR